LTFAQHTPNGGKQLGTFGEKKVGKAKKHDMVEIIETHFRTTWWQRRVLARRTSSILWATPVVINSIGSSSSSNNEEYK
jgi:hypothetical protein